MDSKTFNSHLAKTLNRSIDETATLIDAFGKLLVETGSELDSIAIPGFGSFTPVKHEERVETDAESGRRTLLPPHIAVNFIPGSKLRKLLPNNE